MYSAQLDDFFYNRAVWYLKFAWLPTRCDLSNKLIWFKVAYKGTAMFTGPGNPVFDNRWVTKEDFLFARLKGKI
jgi:hypothetical protein